MLQHQSGVVATETRRPQRRKYLLSGPSQRSLLRPDLKSLVRSRMFTNITLPSRHPLPNPLRQVPFCPISKLRSAAVGGAWRTRRSPPPRGSSGSKLEDQVPDSIITLPPNTWLCAWGRSLHLSAPLRFPPLENGRTATANVYPPLAACQTCPNLT